MFKFTKKNINNVTLIHVGDPGANQTPMSLVHILFKASGALLSMYNMSDEGPL